MEAHTHGRRQGRDHGLLMLATAAGHTPAVPRGAERRAEPRLASLLSAKSALIVNDGAP